MYNSVNVINNKIIGTYNCLWQCARHIKRVDNNMLFENKSLIDLFITFNDKEISEEDYSLYKEYYNSL